MVLEKNRSCEDHLFSLNIVLYAIRSITQKTVYAAFIDLEKAFDWVDRNLLLYRLLQYNIDGKMYNAVKSLYSRTESCVKINNFITEWFIINNGVRQGDSLSPTLFSLNIIIIMIIIMYIFKVPEPGTLRRCTIKRVIEEGVDMKNTLTGNNLLK